MKSLFTDWRSMALSAGGGIFLLTFIVYGISLSNGFVNWDDGLLIFNNPIVQGMRFSNLKAAFTSFDPELYIPFTFVSYQINFLIGGLHPFIYHFTNIFLHALNAVLVMAVIQRLTWSRSAGIFAGLVFAVHPLNVETVVWAAGRKDLLSSFFFLLSLLAYLRYREGRKGWYAWSVAAFLAGLLSKVSILMLPLILVLVDWYEERAITPRALLDKLPYIALSGIFGFVALFGKIGNAFFYKEKFLMACKAIMFYVGQFLWPSQFSVLYPYTDAIEFSTPDLLISLILIVVISLGALLLFLRRHMRLPLFAWLFYLLLLVPTFSNVAKGRNELLDIYFASDRYAYLAMIGLLLALGMGFTLLRERMSGHAWGVAGVLLTILAVLSMRQSLVWHDTKSLFTHVLAVYPDSYVAHVNIGVELYKEGMTQEALYEFGNAIKIRPDTIAYENIGRIFLGQGRTDAARIAFERAIESSPLNMDAHVLLSEILHAQGLYAEEVALLESASTKRTATPEVFRHLGDAYTAMGRTDDAAAAYAKAGQP